MAKKKPAPLYLIPILLKTLDILELLQADNESHTLEALYKKTRFSKTTIYRVLKTLVHRGYITQLGDGSYRHVSRQKKLCFGFGSQSGKMPFSVAVENSLRAAASAAGVDLIVLDNAYDASHALANAEEFLRRNVDVILEFQTDQAVAPIIADKIAAAAIPLIAIDIPHPHATFFGVDGFRCGVAAGEALADEVLLHWNGEVDWVLGLDLAKAGPTVQARVTGAFEALRGKLPRLKPDRMLRMDVGGLREVSDTAVRAFLKERPRSRRILVIAANDMSALGAIDAARSLKRQQHLLVVGQDAIDDMLAELRRPESPAFATISHNAAQYGETLVRLALALLRGENVPPYNFVDYALVSREMAMRDPALRK